MIEVFTPKRIFPDCPFKSNQRPVKFLIQTLPCAVWLRGMMHITELDSTLGCTLWYDAHRGVFWEIWVNWLCGVKNTGSDSVVEFTPRSIFRNFVFMTLLCDAPCGVWPHGMMHTVESGSAVLCTPRSLTPWYDAHCGVWLCSLMHTTESDSVVWCTPWIFLKIRISRQNWNRIRKYFPLFIKGPDGFESCRKWRSQISLHTPVKETKWNWFIQPA